MTAPLTFYIASSRDGLATVAMLAAALGTAGLVNKFDWRAHFDHVCSEETCGVRDRADLKRREVEGARSCDVFIGVSRLGKGSHVELGCALAGEAQLIILVGVDPADSVFYAPGHDDAKPTIVVTTADEVLRVLFGKHYGEGGARKADR